MGHHGGDVFYDKTLVKYEKNIDVKLRIPQEKDQVYADCAQEKIMATHFLTRVNTKR